MVIKSLSALKSMWSDRCSVYVKSKHFNEKTKRTEFTEQCVMSDVPCRLCYKMYTSKLFSSTKGNDDADTVDQKVVLFIGKDADIPSGSKIAVTRGDTVCMYAQSGRPAIYSNHKEIALKLFNEYT